ncbi:MAG: FadR family transcriptional regulator [SAR324 cluster bacterium]|nr:FadR family transcriptional regulator [SAR324 cluster bacterium]MBF0351530.1 FadR family transcriptional regulator [SAR324 cluster bacterium]
MTEQNLPDKIADLLIQQIFTGVLKPGQKLAAERTLAAEMGVDRTSLKMAIRQLARMNVVKSVRGSGVTVQDYRLHSGLDFLGAALSIPDLKIGKGILLEAIDLWVSFLPAGCAMAVKRGAPADLLEIEGICSRQLKLLNEPMDFFKIVQLETEIQDKMIIMQQSTVLTLFANSTRQLRRTMLQMYLETVDIRTHVNYHRSLIGKVLIGQLDSENIRDEYRSYLIAQTRFLREKIAQMPPDSEIYAEN